MRGLLPLLTASTLGTGALALHELRPIHAQAPMHAREPIVATPQVQTVVETAPVRSTWRGPLPFGAPPLVVKADPLIAEPLMISPTIALSDDIDSDDVMDESDRCPARVINGDENDGCPEVTTTDPEPNEATAIEPNEATAIEPNELTAIEPNEEIPLRRRYEIIIY